MNSSFDIAVIGGGAAGCTAAVEAARLGARVVLVEQERLLGGVSWHRRRLPARLLQAAVRTHRTMDADTIDPSVVELSKLLPDLDARRRRQAEALANTLQKHGVMRLHARAKLVSSHAIALTTVHGVTHQIEAERIILATGDRPRSPRGARIDHEAVLDMGSVLSAVYLPRSVVVAGEGPSACEMATLLGHLGCEVTLAVPGRGVLEGLDPILAETFLASFQAAGGTFLPHHTLTRAQRDGQGGAHCTLTPSQGGPLLELNPDRVVVATRRKASVRSLGLRAIGLGLNADGYLSVDAHFRTSIPSIAAVGAVIGAGSSPSRIRYQARQAIERALCEPTLSDPTTMPFMDTILAAPELATIGLPEHSQDGLQTTIVADGETGLKLVANEAHQVVGLHAWGPGAEQSLHTLEQVVQQRWPLPSLARAEAPAMRRASEAARRLLSAHARHAASALHPDDLLAGLIPHPKSTSAA